MSLGEELINSRLLKGVSVKEASEKINISRSYLVNLEKGNRKKPSLKILKNISLYYEINYEKLLYLSNYKTDYSYQKFESNEINKIINKINIELKKLDTIKKIN